MTIDEAKRGSTVAAGPPGRWIRFGFGAVAMIDAALNVALHRAPKVSAAVHAQAFAMVAFHVVAIGLIIGALADAGHRLLPHKRWAAPVATLAITLPLALAIFRDDYSVFEPPIRAGLLAASVAPYVGLVAARSWLRRARARSLALGVVGLALTVANPLMLAVEYEGVHLATTILAGLVGATALEGIFAAAYERRARSRGRALPAAALALTCVAAAASLVYWPSNRVLVFLSRLPTASVVPWLADLRDVSDSGSLEGIAQDQRAWFTSRASAPAVPPTKPALHERPIVVFVTIDALRADIVNEGARKETSNLRRIAEHGATFTFAHSSASATSASIAALFAGRHYSTLYWTKHPTARGKTAYFTGDDDYTGFPTLLEDAGVRTTCVVTQQGFEPRFGLSRGFGEYTEEIRGAKRRVERILAWLDGVGDERELVYAHIMDAHYPYTDGGKGTLYERYLGAVRVVDEQMGRLWDKLQSPAFRDRAYLVVSADHGEGFNEHDKTQHGNSVYEEVTHIPLLVAGPGIAPARIDEPVSLIDVGPTLLDLFGLETPGAYLGQSLVPLLAGDRTHLTRPIVMDSDCGRQSMIDRDRVKIIRDVRRRTIEIYDLQKDPGEQVNLADNDPEDTEKRTATLAAFIKAHEMKRRGYKTPYR